MTESDTDNCWAVFKCDKDKVCPARMEEFKDNKCWRVASKQIDYIPSGVKVREGVKACWNCKFFQCQNSEFFTF